MMRAAYFCFPVKIPQKILTITYLIAHAFIQAF